MKNILRLLIIIIAIFLAFSLVVNASSYRGDIDHEDDEENDDEGFFDMLSRITDDITGLINDIANLPAAVAQMVSMAISGLMEFVAKSYLAAVLKLIATFFKSLENLLTDANLDLNHPIVKTIFNVLRPTSSTLAVLFLIIQVTKSAATFEAVDITRTMKYSLFFVLSIFAIDNSLNILTLIVQGFAGLTQKVLALGYGASSVNIFSKELTLSFTNVGDSIGACLLATILALLICFMALSMYITLAIRSVEILIMAAASGLFASTLASDATIDVFKSFIKSFVATVSSTLFMAIAFALFASIANIQFITGDYAYVDVVIKLTAILAYCIRAPQTIRSILGYGSPSVNALAVVKSLMFH